MVKVRPPLDSQTLTSYMCVIHPKALAVIFKNIFNILSISENGCQAAILDFFQNLNRRASTRHISLLSCIISRKSIQWFLRSDVGRTDGRTDGQTDGRTDRRTKAVHISPPKTKSWVGIISSQDFQEQNHSSSCTTNREREQSMAG